VKASAVSTILRDAGSFALGAFVVVYETVKVPQPNPFLLLVALVLLGVPGAIGLVTLARGKQETQDTTSGSPTSQSQQSLLQ
jgi:hypothetical protein